MVQHIFVAFCSFFSFFYPLDFDGFSTRIWTNMVEFVKFLFFSYFFFAHFLFVESWSIVYCHFTSAHRFHFSCSIASSFYVISIHFISFFTSYLYVFVFLSFSLLHSDLLLAVGLLNIFFSSLRALFWKNYGKGRMRDRITTSNDIQILAGFLHLPLYFLEFRWKLNVLTIDSRYASAWASRTLQRTSNNSDLFIRNYLFTSEQQAMMAALSVSLCVCILSSVSLGRTREAQNCKPFEQINTFWYF